MCSEREPGGYEDCTWASAVMLDNANHGWADVPSTRTEYQALRVAGGDGPGEKPGDGSNQRQAQIGMMRRYGWAPTRIGVPGFPTTFSSLWVRLQPGSGASVQGSFRRFPPGHRYRRWDPDFVGGHCAYVQRESRTERVWWMDPLAPSSYAGEWMTKADLQRYVDGFPGGHLIAPVAEPFHAHFRYGGRATNPFPDRTRADEDQVRVHWRPSVTDATVIDHLERDELFVASQLTERGDTFRGSTRWYGDHHGRRWVHAARLRREGGAT
jgi:hypothetical protein